MELRIIDNKVEWDAPLLTRKHSQFLQSWDWGVFQQMIGRDVIRMRAFEGDVPLVSMQAMLHPLPLGHSYWYVPRGPHLHQAGFVPESFFINALQMLHDQHGETMFVRIEPLTKGAVTGVTIPTVQPAHELAIKLYLGEQELLDAMREKTRYNIRLAARKGVTVRRIEQAEYALRAFPKVWTLLQSTAKRQGIHTHAKEYYEVMLQTLLPTGQAQLFVAEYEKRIIAAHVTIGFGDSLYYAHGASSGPERQLMAPHLLHWTAMQYGKEKGFNYYNFGGVSPLGSENHRWQSLTHFKQGFGNLDTIERVSYPRAVDLVQRPVWYWVYNNIKRIRR